MRCLIAFFIWMMACPVLADDMQGVLGSVSSVTASCTTDNDTELVSYTGNSLGVSFGSSAWKAQKFTLASPATLTRITLSLNDISTADLNTVTVSIRSDSGGVPTGSDIDGTTINLSETSVPEVLRSAVNFDYSTPVTLNSGTYHLIIRSMNQDASTDLFYGSVVGGGYTYSSNSGSSWTSYDATAYHVIYGCQ